MEKRADLVSKERLIDERGSESLHRVHHQMGGDLVFIALAVFVFFNAKSPYFLDWFNLMNATFHSRRKPSWPSDDLHHHVRGHRHLHRLDHRPLRLRGGNAALAGASIPTLILLSLLVGTAAGFFNGIMITTLEMPAIAVTLATQSIFRGISIGLLEDQARTKFPRTSVSSAKSSFRDHHSHRSPSIWS